MRSNDSFSAQERVDGIRGAFEEFSNALDVLALAEKLEDSLFLNGQKLWMQRRRERKFPHNLNHPAQWLIQVVCDDLVAISFKDQFCDLLF